MKAEIFIYVEGKNGALIEKWDSQKPYEASDTQFKKNISNRAFAIIKNGFDYTNTDLYRLEGERSLLDKMIAGFNIVHISPYVINRVAIQWDMANK